MEYLLNYRDIPHIIHKIETHSIVHLFWKESHSYDTRSAKKLI